MTKYLFITESYAISANLKNVLDPGDRAVLITKDVHTMLSQEQLSHFERVIVLPEFTYELIRDAVKEEIKLMNNEGDVRIVSHDDFFYDLIAKVNEALGLKGYTLNEILPFINKHIMKDRLKNSPVRCPHFIKFDPLRYQAHTRIYIEEIMALIPFPIFAKPIDKAGAVGVKKIMNQLELTRWCEEHKEDTNYELDEYIADSKLFHCDSFIQEGKVMFNIVSEYAYPCADYAFGKPLGSMMLPPESELSQEIGYFAYRVIEQFSKHAKVPDGVSHMEIFRKPTGELIFLEVQLRSPGANVKKAYQEYWGEHLDDYHFRLQMQKPIMLPSKKGGYSAWIYFPTEEGTIDSLISPPLPKEQIIESTFYIEPGKITHLPDNILDIKSRGLLALSLVFINDDHSELIKSFRFLTQHFKPYTLVPKIVEDSEASPRRRHNSHRISWSADSAREENSTESDGDSNNISLEGKQLGFN